MEISVAHVDTECEFFLPSILYGSLYPGPFINSQIKFIFHSMMNVYFALSYQNHHTAGIFTFIIRIRSASVLIFSPLAINCNPTYFSVDLVSIMWIMYGNLSKYHFAKYNIKYPLWCGVISYHLQQQQQNKKMPTFLLIDHIFICLILLTWYSFSCVFLLFSSFFDRKCNDSDVISTVMSLTMEIPIWKTN